MIAIGSGNKRFGSGTLLRQFIALLFAVGVSAAWIAAPAVANVLVNDTWLDGTDTDPASTVYAENNGVTGTDADTDGDLESAWFRGGDGTLNPAGMGGPQVGKFASTASASWTTYFAPEGSEVNLANAGDALKVTWMFKPINVNASNTSQFFRIAVVDSPSTARLVSATEGAPGTAAYSGYGIFANMGQTLGNSSPYRLMERTGASGSMLSGSGDWTAIGTTGASNGSHGYDSGTEYTFLMTITRTASSELQIDTSMAGGTLNNSGTASVSFLDTTPNNGNFKFDTFSLRPSSAVSTAEEFDMSRFKVEFITTSAPPVLAGDYNGDHKVDAADYTTWRDNFGAAAGTLPNDTVGGDIDNDQFNVWLTKFNSSNGSGGLRAAPAPEPAALVLAAVGMVAIVLSWKGKGRV